MAEFTRDLGRFVSDVTSDRALKGFVRDAVRDKVAALREKSPALFDDLSHRAGRDFRKRTAPPSRNPSLRKRGLLRSTKRAISILDRVPEGSKRFAERPFDARGQKRTRSLKPHSAPKDFRGSAFQDMPHGRFPRASMRSRSNIKSRSRNLQSQITMGRPMRSVAKRTQYAEVKYLTGTVPLVNDSMFHLSAVTQGVTHLTRIGDDIKALALNVIYQVRKTALSTDAQLDQWRFTIFQWSPRNNVPPTPADIFDDNPAGRPTRQFFNLSRKPLYKVMYDASGTLSGTLAAVNVGTSSTGVVKAALTIPKSVLNYDPTTVVGVDQVYCLFQSFNFAGETPSGDITWRLTYIDS